MDFEKCPKCRTIRMHEDGKCLSCGYISSVRASINALYSSKRTKKYQRKTNSSLFTSSTKEKFIKNIY